MLQKTEKLLTNTFNVFGSSTCILFLYPHQTLVCTAAKQRTEKLGGPKQTEWYFERSHCPSGPLLNTATVPSASAQITLPSTCLHADTTLLSHGLRDKRLANGIIVVHGNTTYTILTTESFNLIECKHLRHCETAECTKM